MEQNKPPQTYPPVPQLTTGIPVGTSIIREVGVAEQQFSATRTIRKRVNGERDSADRVFAAKSSIKAYASLASNRSSVKGAVKIEPRKRRGGERNTPVLANSTNSPAIR